jgi:hypothetical protein
MYGRLYLERRRDLLFRLYARYFVFEVRDQKNKERQQLPLWNVRNYCVSAV